MKKVTGFFFIATALFLLGSTFKPFAEEAPRITKIEAPITKFAEEAPRITQAVDIAKPFSEELPRLI